MSSGLVRCAKCSTTVGQIALTVRADGSEEWRDVAVDMLRAHKCPPRHAGKPESVESAVEAVRAAVAARGVRHLALERSVARAAALHVPDPYDPKGRRCVDCEQLYPCNTRVALGPVLGEPVLVETA